MLLYVIICYYMLLYGIIYYYMLSYVIICYYKLLDVIIFYHIIHAISYVCINIYVGYIYILSLK